MASCRRPAATVTRFVGGRKGERVTIPALPDTADWTAFKTARAALLPNLSHRLPDERYSRRSIAKVRLSRAS
jgi:hypothetical protein